MKAPTTNNTVAIYKSESVNAWQSNDCIEIKQREIESLTKSMNMTAADYLKPHPTNRKLRYIIPEGVKMAKSYMAKYGSYDEVYKETGISPNTLTRITNGECSFRTWVRLYDAMTTNLQPAA